MQALRPSVCLVLAAALHCGGATPPPASPSSDPDLAPAASPSPPPAAEATPLSLEAKAGVAALEGNDVAGAKAHFQAALKLNPADADALYYLGAIDEQAGDVAGAEPLYRKALEARPAFEMASVNLSGLCDDAQRYDDALAVLTPAVAAHPKNGSLHMNAGIAHAGKKEAEIATREFEAALVTAPADPMFRLVYGHWLAVLGQKDAAVAQLQGAASRGAKNVGVVAAVAHELHLARAFAECVVVSGQAIALKDAAELWTERASCKIGMSDDPGATADLRVAVVKEPSYAPAHYYLGNQLAKAGDWAGAVTEYQAFLKLEPKGALAQSVAEKIRLARQHGGR